MRPVSAGVFYPLVDRARCEGKAECVSVCPFDVFQVAKISTADFQALSFLGRLKSRVHGGRTAYTPNAELCQACSLCVKSCPEQAISLARVHAPD